MTKRWLIPVLLLMVFALAACGGQPEVTPTPEATPTVTPTPTPEPTPTPDPIAERLAGMTVEQKVGQLLVAGIDGLEPGDDGAQAVADYRVGGVILFGRNVESAGQLTQLTNGLKALNGDYVPLFLSVDQEGGRVDRMPPEVEELPAAYDYIRAGGDPQARGRVLAAECAAFGLNLNFSTCLDVWSNPENTVIGDRAYGTDWESVTQAGLAVNQGLTEGGVIPVVKHFPGHGDTLEDSHETLPVVDKPLEELEESELKPFQAAVDQGVPVVMVGHILLRQIDPENPASLSEQVVTGLLRQELGFDGVVCTDDLTMAAISDSYGMGEAAVLAVEAGCDLLLVCHEADNLTAARDALLEAVNSGRISMDRLDESVYRLLALKAEWGLTNLPVEEPDIEALNARIQAILP